MDSALQLLSVNYGNKSLFIFHGNLKKDGVYVTSYEMKC